MLAVLAVTAGSAGGSGLAAECELEEPNYDLLRCLIAADCDWREEFPEEVARHTQGVAEWKSHILQRLDEEGECLSFDALAEGTKAQLNRIECLSEMHFLGSVLLDMVLSGSIVASQPNNMPASRFGLAQNGPCN